MYSKIFFWVELILACFASYNLMSFGVFTEVSILSIALLYLFGLSSILFSNGPVLTALVYAYRHYIVLAVYAKIIILSNHPELALGSLQSFDTNIFKNNLSDTLISFVAYSFAIYLSLLTVSVFTRIKTSTTTTVYRSDFSVGNAFNILILICVLIKFGLSQLFDLAKPGIPPIEIPIPMVTGLLNNYCIHVVLVLCSFLLLTKNVNKFFSVFIVLLNLSIDFYNGYKFSIITTILITVIYTVRGQSIDILSMLSRNKLFSLLAAFLVGLYPIIDLYSDMKASLGSVDLEVLFELASSEFSDVAIYLPFAEIVRRVNGIDTYMMMEFFTSNNQVPISSLFDSSMIQLINDGMYGRNSSNVVSAAGSTIFLPLNLSLGNFLGSVLIYFLMGFVVIIMMMSYYILIRNSLLRRIFLAFMCIEFIRYVFSAGDYVNNVKLTLMYIVTFYLLNLYMERKNAQER